MVFRIIAGLRELLSGSVAVTLATRHQHLDVDHLLMSLHACFFRRLTLHIHDVHKHIVAFNFVLAHRQRGQIVSLEELYHFVKQRIERHIGTQSA